jgi:hypothetical protein
MKRISLILSLAVTLFVLLEIPLTQLALASTAEPSPGVADEPLALRIPNFDPRAQLDSPAVRGAKWIDINLSRQTISAYIGSTLIKRVLVSTGTWRHPTVVGRFRIYAKVHSQTMSGGSRAAGDYYRLPGVPHVMYFYQGYAIHGTYWHHNFGRRMSHGCVNLSLANADWFYGWTPYSTLVVTHY